MQSSSNPLYSVASKDLEQCRQTKIACPPKSPSLLHREGLECKSASRMSNPTVRIFTAKSSLEIGFMKRITCLTINSLSPHSTRYTPRICLPFWVKCWGTSRKTPQKSITRLMFGLIPRFSMIESLPDLDTRTRFHQRMRHSLGPSVDVACYFQTCKWQLVAGKYKVHWN